MRVFISWSGNRSQAVAEALRDWLPLVFDWVEPWVSSADIHAGSRWASEVARALDESDIGVLCVTERNANAPWLLFEAGALSRKLSSARVIPYYLHDTIPEQLKKGPLSQFQAIKADKDGTKALIQCIASFSNGPKRPDATLGRVYSRVWPYLYSKLKAIQAEVEDISNYDQGGIGVFIPKDIKVLSLVSHNFMTNEAGTCTRTLYYSIRNVGPDPIRSYLIDEKIDQPIDPHFSLHAEDSQGRTLKIDMSMDTMDFKRWQVVFDHPLQPGEIYNFFVHYVSFDSHCFTFSFRERVFRAAVVYVFPLSVLKGKLLCEQGQGGEWGPATSAVIHDSPFTRTVVFQSDSADPTVHFRIRW